MGRLMHNHLALSRVLEGRQAVLAASAQNEFDQAVAVAQH